MDWLFKLKRFGLYCRIWTPAYPIDGFVVFEARIGWEPKNWGVLVVWISRGHGALQWSIFSGATDRTYELTGPIRRIV